MARPLGGGCGLTLGRFPRALPRPPALRAPPCPVRPAPRSPAPSASAPECWAVGYYSSASETDDMLIEGLESGDRSLSVPAAGSDTDSSDGHLYAVACAAADECWAVGQSTDGDNYDQVLVEGWSGTSWTSVAAPDRSTAETAYSGDVNNTLYGAACAPAGECWAVGSSGYSTTPPSSRSTPPLRPRLRRRRPSPCRRPAPPAA